MEATQISRLVAGSMILPFLRPLPVIFGYIRRMTESPQPIARAKFFDDEFHSHLNSKKSDIYWGKHEINRPRSFKYCIGKILGKT